MLLMFLDTLNLVMYSGQCSPSTGATERTGQRPSFYYPSDVGSMVSVSLVADLVPWFQKLADVLEVNKVVSYSERSIRCQRNNNPVENPNYWTT